MSTVSKLGTPVYLKLLICMTNRHLYHDRHPSWIIRGKPSFLVERFINGRRKSVHTRIFPIASVLFILIIISHDHKSPAVKLKKKNKTKRGDEECSLNLNLTWNAERKIYDFKKIVRKSTHSDTFVISQRMKHLLYR